MVAPVVNMSEVTDDEQAIARNSFVEIEHSQIGKTIIHGPPFKIEDSWEALPPPDFGSSTIEILTKLKYSKEEQIALFKTGAIR